MNRGRFVPQSTIDRRMAAKDARMARALHGGSMPRPTLLDALESFFRAHPDEWIDGRRLEQIAGRYAWRTRVSDLRTQRGMTTIINRQRTVRPPADRPLLRPFTISEYCFVTAPSADSADSAMSPLCGEKP